MGNLLDTILNLPGIKQTRRNHALEHAVVHLLSRKQRDTSIYARSSPNAIFVYGDLPTELVATAVNEARERLRQGEYQLAIHPNCGTNLVTAGGLSGLAAVAALGVQSMGKKKRGLWQLLSSLPLVVLAATAALLLAQPLGQSLQLNVTTDGDIGDLRITSITRRNQGRLVYHVIKTAN